MVAMATVIAQVRWMHFQQRQPLIHFQIFDGASRGPLGSIQLILLVRNSLAMAAAMVTVCALGYEASAQQSFTVSRGTFIPNISNLYGIDASYFITFVTMEDFSFPPGTETLPESSQTTCGSRECWTPPYASLGLCSSCSNSTTALVTTCERDNSCISRLPSGLQLNSSQDRMVFATNPTTLDPTTWPPSMLVNFTTIGSGTSMSGEVTPLRMAHSCQINLCARVYVAYFQGSSAPEPEEYEMARVDSSWTSAGGAAKQLQMVVPNGTMLQTPYYDRPIPSNQTRWQSSLPPFTADPQSIKEFRNFFNLMFNSAISTTSYTNESLPTPFQERADYLLWESVLFGSCFDSTGFASGIVDTFPDFLSSFSAYMTTSIRGSVNTTDQTATVGTYEYFAYFHVRWIWLILPLVLEILGTVLLAATIILTKRRHMPIWKTSTTATLYHGIEVAAVAESASAEHISLMDDCASSQEFQLRATAMGYRLVRCNDTKFDDKGSS